MSLPTYHTTKSTYFFNFLPTKAEEEASASSSTSIGSRYQRVLIEIRDLYAPPILNPHDPWQIKKTLSDYEIATGKIIVSFYDTFEYIIRYWNFSMSTHVALLGHRVAVVLWDVTSAKNPRKYEGNEVYFQITPNENYVLTCMELIRERNLKANDYIGLYWDSTESSFRIKLFYTRTN